MIKDLDEYILTSLKRIRDVRETNNNLEKGLMFFLCEDSNVMYFKNEEEIEDTFIDSIQLLINKDASDLVDYYLSECGVGDEENYIVKKILSYSDEEKNKEYNFSLNHNDKEIRFLIYDDSSLLQALKKIKSLEE